MAIYGEGFSKEIGGVKEGTDVGEDKHVLGHAVAEPIPTEVHRRTLFLPHYIVG
jgi:hypothetical protein